MFKRANFFLSFFKSINICFIFITETGKVSKHGHSRVNESKERESYFLYFSLMVYV